MLLPPSAGLLLQSCDASELLEPPLESNLFAQCAAAKLILLPVVNSSIVEQASRRSATGSHWSLLACWPAQSRAIHYDSMPGSGNFRYASALATKLGALLDKPLDSVKSGKSPTQLNVYDCGPCMLSCASALLHDKDPGNSEVETPQAIRAKLLRIAQDLSEQEKKAVLR